MVTTALSLDGARVNISTNFSSGDVLNFAAASKPAAVTGSYKTTSGVLTFTGTATAPSTRLVAYRKLYHHRIFNLATHHTF